MPEGLITLLDIAKRNVRDSEMIMIDETTKAVPEVSGVHPRTMQQLPGVAEARTIKGTSYETSVRVELPGIDFRDINEGTDFSKSRREKRIVSCHNTTPKWGVDKLAENIDDNLEDLLADEAAAHLAAYWHLIGRCFYYGTNAAFGSARSFPGLLQAYDASSMTVDATGSTADACSSVWAVKFGPDAVRWVSGMNGKHEITDPRIGDLTDAKGKTYTGWIQELEARPGLQVGSQLQVARIKNLTVAKPLTSDMLGDLVNKFKLAYQPDVIFATKRSIEQYRKDLQAVTSSPNRVPTPTDFEGTPLVPTESLVDTEPVNLAA